MLDNSIWAQGRGDRDILDGYVHQKLFVVMLHLATVAHTTTVLDNYEGINQSINQSNNDEPTNDRPTLKQQSVLLAATFMSKLDIGRICVCEGNMLSVFLKGAFIVRDPYGQWRMADINLNERLEFDTLWTGFGLGSGLKSRITTYMMGTMIPESVPVRDSLSSHPDNAVDPNMVPPLNLAQSHVTYVYWSFAKEILQFQDILKDPNRMEPKHRKQLLMWTKRVWKRLCKAITEQELRAKYDVIKEIDKTIREITMDLVRDAGPTEMEE
jgi:hypothetical protein